MPCSDVSPGGALAPGVCGPVLRLPSLRASLRHAVPPVIEGALGPLAAFYVGLSIAQTRGAIVAALAWSGLIMARRRLRQEKIPAIVLVGALLLALRSAIAWEAHSAVLYFVQPAVGTALVGVAFLVSALARRPLTERFAHDFCPLGPELRAWPAVRRFFVHIALLWALLMLVDAGVVLWLLLTTSLQVFLVERTAVTWVVYAAGIAASTLWFVALLRRHGVRVAFAARPGEPAELSGLFSPTLWPQGLAAVPIGTPPRARVTRDGRGTPQCATGTALASSGEPAIVDAARGSEVRFAERGGAHRLDDAPVRSDRAALKANQAETHGL